MLHGSLQAAVTAALIFSYLLKTPSCPVKTFAPHASSVCGVLTCILNQHQPAVHSVMGRSQCHEASVISFCSSSAVSDMHNTAHTVLDELIS